MASSEYQIKIHHVGNVFAQEEQTSFPTMNQLIFPFSSTKGKIDLSKRVENVINSLKALLKDFENIKGELDCRTHQDKENQSTNQIRHEFSFERAKEALPTMNLLTRDLQRQLKETFDTYKDLKRFFNNSGGNESRRESLQVRSRNVRDSTLLDLNKLNSPSDRSPQSKLYETLSLVPDKVSTLSAFIEEEFESSPYRANDRLFKDISPIHLPQIDTTFSRHCYLLGAENSDCGDEKSFRIQLLRPECRSFNKSNSNFKQQHSGKVETDKDMSTELSIEFEVAEETQQLPLTTMILEHLD